MNEGGVGDAVDDVAAAAESREGEFEREEEQQAQLIELEKRHMQQVSELIASTEEFQSKLLCSSDLFIPS